MQPIRLSGHAREQSRFRGATEGEIIEAIRSAPWGTAESGRFDCRMDFAYGSEWNGRFCTAQQVRPIFAEEADEIVVVTVYGYYY